MSHFLHVWKHLRNYVSGVWLPENPETKSLETAAVLSLGNMIQDLDKSVRYSQHDLQNSLLAPELQKSLEEWTKAGTSLTFNIEERKLHEEIYDVLGNRALTPEIVNKSWTC